MILLALPYHVLITEYAGAITGAPVRHSWRCIDHSQATFVLVTDPRSHYAEVAVSGH